MVIAASGEVIRTVMKVRQVPDRMRMARLPTSPAVSSLQDCATFFEASLMGVTALDYFPQNRRMLVIGDSTKER